MSLSLLILIDLAFSSFEIRSPESYASEALISKFASPLVRFFPEAPGEISDSFYM
jgi:hypothetical protein